MTQKDELSFLMKRIINYCKGNKEKDEFYSKYLRKLIPGEDLHQIIKNPDYSPDSMQQQPRISQEEIDTKYRNYAKKEVRSSLTTDLQNSQITKQKNAPQKTKIPVPSFAAQHQRKRKLQLLKFIESFL